MEMMKNKSHLYSLAGNHQKLQYVKAGWGLGIARNVEARLGVGCLGLSFETVHKRQGNIYVEETMDDERQNPVDGEMAGTGNKMKAKQKMHEKAIVYLNGAY